MALSTPALCKSFRSLKDPRINRCQRHRLLDIVTIALCAVLGAADTCKEIALFARRRRDWFGRFLTLPNGIPAHHTFRRVFGGKYPLEAVRGHARRVYWGATITS